MTTFEDSEKESEYGYVRKVNHSFSFPLYIHFDSVLSLRFVVIVLLIDPSLDTVLCILNFTYSSIDSIYQLGSSITCLICVLVYDLQLFKF